MSRIQEWFGNGWFGIAELLLTAFCVFLSLSVHEFAHGYVAYIMGDDTAKRAGRLNLNPVSHLDPIGALCLFLFGFGWAKPIPVNPMRFDRGKMKVGMVVTSLAGPIANLLLAFIATFFFKLLTLTSTVGVVFRIITALQAIVVTLISMNIGLAIFNLIPIPPLDGSKVLNAVLPARTYFKIMEYERYGFIILIVLINLPVFNSFLNICVYGIYNFFSAIIGLIPFL